jgi:regulator of protease activity HflC (stomatin/prohibitin superfamily)
MVQILALILLFAGIIILFKTVRMVPQGFAWTVERFGKYTHTMEPGIGTAGAADRRRWAARST